MDAWAIRIHNGHLATSPHVDIVIFLVNEGRITVRYVALTISVTKADGTRQLFDREKVIRTCLRIGASREVAETIAENIERNIHDGIKTRRILQMIFKQLSERNPAVDQLIDLRTALSLMQPKPDFERFIQILLSEHGYTVVPNQIVRGKCVEHEIDAVARKDGKTYIVEVKHHVDHHTLTGLDTSRIARAVFEDITEGFELGLNTLEIDKAMIVSNTKFSEHAQRYAECRGIRHIGWSSPRDHNLRTMITEKKLYPITYIKGLDTKMMEKLSYKGMILLKQLTTKNPEELSRETGIPTATLNSIAERAKRVETL